MIFKLIYFVVLYFYALEGIAEGGVNEFIGSKIDLLYINRGLLTLEYKRKFILLAHELAVTGHGQEEEDTYVSFLRSLLQDVFYSVVNTRHRLKPAVAYPQS